MPDQPRLTAAQEAEVRRMLADARHTDPMPAEVAERIDRVLADLAGEPSREATVVRLADRRRRAATMLVAAAAVVVAGVGVAQVVGGGGGDAEDATSAGVADEPEAAEAAPERDQAGGGDQAPDATTPRSGEVPARVRPRWFAEDVARLERRDATAYAAGEDAEELEGALSDRRALRTWCEPGGWGQGRYEPVRYGKAEGYVVFRRVRGETRVADLFLCGSELAVRSVTLPSP